MWTYNAAGRVPPRQHVGTMTKQDLDQRKDKLLSMMQSVMEQSTTPIEPKSDISAPSAHMANATTNNKIQLQILQLIQQLQQDMKRCIATTTNFSKDNKKFYRKTQDNGGMLHKDISKYC